MSKSDFLENAVLNHVLGATAYTAPGTIHVALYTVTPSDAGGGTEVSGGSYARAAVTNNVTNWPAASGGSKSNGTVVTFPTPTANWGQAVAFGLLDAASAGNLLYWAALTNPKNINAGDPAPTFPVATLVVQET